MKTLRLVSLVLAGLALATLPACNQAPPGKAGRVKVAFITNNSYDFWKIAQRGTEKAAPEFDVDVEFKMPSGGGSAEEQRRIIEDLLAKGIKGIAISPNDAANQTEFFKQVATKVPFITQDSDVPDTSARRCYIGTDNYKAGRAVGELVKKAVPEGGELVIYVGKLDVQNAVERRQGVLDELAGKEKGKGDPAEKDHKYGKFTLLDTMTDDGHREKCQANVEDTLVKHPEVACLVGLWEYNPPAILRAVTAAKKLGKVTIVGFDENDETLDGIKNGHVYATVVQDPYMFGYEAIKILAALARNDDSVLKGPEIDSEGRLYVSHKVIDKDNVQKFHEELNKRKGK
jgi:ribose transport system substrate-binding protein